MKNRKWFSLMFTIILTCFAVVYIVRYRNFLMAALELILAALLFVNGYLGKNVQWLKWVALAGVLIVALKSTLG